MRTRSTLATLVALVSLLGLVLVNVGGASGLHEGTSDTEFVGLHLDSDGAFFYHAELAPQHLGISQCLVTDAPAIGSLVSFAGSNKGLGLSFDSLGVRSQGPGRSCGRTSGGESFEISINNATDDLLADLNFYSMELDIEAKQNAVVVAETFLGGSAGTSVGIFELRTGSSATAPPIPGDTTHSATSTAGEGATANCLQGVSDSGADSGANDNCRWTIEPGVPFDTVVFTTPEGGEFGLEGGEDTGEDSLFYLTDVGVLDCGDTEVTGDGLGAPLVSVTRRAQTDCQLKEFTLGSGAFPADVGIAEGADQSFTFDPSGGGAGQANATFDMTVTWVPEPAQNPVPATLMDYDGDGSSDGSLVWCDGTTAAPALPGTGEPWCLVEQHTTLVGSGMMQVVERLFGTEDPSGWR